MKIIISRRNFLLSASAAAAFGPRLIKQAKAAEEGILHDISQANLARLLAVDGQTLATVQDIICTKTDDWLTLATPDFTIEKDGLADRIAACNNDTMIFTVSLTDRCNVTFGSTVKVDNVYIGAPRSAF